MPYLRHDDCEMFLLSKVEEEYEYVLGIAVENTSRSCEPVLKSDASAFPVTSDWINCGRV